MGDVGRVVAVVPDEEEAERTRADLSFHGIGAEVHRPDPGTYMVEDGSLRQHAEAARIGILVGFLLGGLVGLVVVLAVPAVREWPLVFRLLLIGGLALQGTMPAIMWRMGQVDRYDDDPEAAVDLAADDWLVIVRDPHDASRAHRIVENHQATFLTDEEPLELAS